MSGRWSRISAAAGLHRCTGLSLGPDEEVDEYREPSRWTATLDQLAHELGITFVTAAGNNGEDDKTLGYNRVQVPADMVNGIGVGACPASSESARLDRSRYSAVGPGREGQRVQPTGLAFGGSDAEPFVGFDEKWRLPPTRDPSVPGADKSSDTGVSSRLS